MRDSCRPYRHRLTEVENASADADLAAHLATCQSCSDLLARYRAMANSASEVLITAPASLISWAKSLMPSGRRLIVARRLGSSLLAGARGPGTEFQIVVGSEDISIRLMATKEGSGWQIMGRFPEGEWGLESAYPVSIEQDGFTLDVPSLQESGFAIVGTDESIQVPSLSELLMEGD